MSTGRITLSIDVGASFIKAGTLGPRGGAISEPLKVETPKGLSPSGFSDALVDIARGLKPFHRVSVGLPGIVHRGVVYSLPTLGDRRFRRFHLAEGLRRHLRRPVRILNDAEMHGLGVIRRRGVELVLTLGTGLGTALYLDGELGPRFEFLSPPDDEAPPGGVYGDAARKEVGTRRWNRRVFDVIEVMRRLTNFDRCYVGGGNALKLRGRLPRSVTRIENAAATLGGVRLWEWNVRT